MTQHRKSLDSCVERKMASPTAGSQTAVFCSCCIPTEKLQTLSIPDQLPIGKEQLFDA